MKAKKIPYYLAPWFLMAGASLTIGLLSFGGILAIWPAVPVAFAALALPVAFAAFILSVAYEGEIYLQNIRGSLKKLVKSNHLERELAKVCLLDHFPETSAANCPQFFKDYERQLQLLHLFEGKRLNKASRKNKRHIEKTLTDMEKWFAVQLFSTSTDLTGYQDDLRMWLDAHEQASRSNAQKKRGSRHLIYQGLQLFCLTAGVFMGLGTTYLLVEAFAVIPLLAALSAATLPIIIVPMAVIAGVAYGLLVYNAMTDMVATEMVTKWLNKLRKDFADPEKFGRSVAMSVGLSVMFVLTLALSICTAGTWWTVAKTSQPLFRWMGKMPSFIMLMINPLISSVSTWAFNVENVSETLELVDTWFEPVEPVKDKKNTRLKDKENTPPVGHWLQRLNPFRMLINVAFAPLRFLLFVGHLVSIGVTADRVPGVSPIASALLGVVNEGVEDFHYFDLFGKQVHAHKHDTRSLLKERLGAQQGHNHDSDLPTKFLTALFSPLYVLAAGWELLSSGESEDGFDSWEAFGKAVDKEAGLPVEEHVNVRAGDLCCDRKTKKGTFKALPQVAWQFEHAVFRIERHKEKHLQDTDGCESVKKQREELMKLQGALGYYAAVYCGSSFLPPVSVDSVINKHCSFFKSSPDAKDTCEFLDALPSRVAAAA